MALERLIAAPGYQRMNDDQRAEVLERAIERARRRASVEIGRDERRGRVGGPAAESTVRE